MARIELRIDEVLESRGKTAYWLAKELEMNHGNLYKYRKSQIKAFNLETLTRMCELLECSPGDLIALVEDKPEGKRKAKAKA